MPDDSAVSRHVRMLKSEHAEEHKAAVSWLLAHPEEAEPVLADQTQAGNSGNPELFMRLLATIGSPRSIPALETALTRGNQGESFYAAQALAIHPHADARAALVRGLENPNPTVRISVADALWATKASWACPALEKARADPDETVRARVARAAEAAGCIK
jgi:hypothetical protein